jgi:hypothetical protein
MCCCRLCSTPAWRKSAALHPGRCGRRHLQKSYLPSPQVFGQTKVSGTGDVLRNWEVLKRKEKDRPPIPMRWKRWRAAFRHVEGGKDPEQGQKGRF